MFLKCLPSPKDMEPRKTQAEYRLWEALASTRVHTTPSEAMLLFFLYIDQVCVCMCLYIVHTCACGVCVLVHACICMCLYVSICCMCVYLFAFFLIRIFLSFLKNFFILHTNPNSHSSSPVTPIFSPFHPHPLLIQGKAP